MTDETSGEDKALLARFNALKPSTPNPNALPVMHPESEDTPEDLIARFRRFQGGKAHQQETAASLESLAVDDQPASPTIQELLAEIGPEDGYIIDQSEIKDAEALLVEARAAVSSQEANGENPIPVAARGEEEEEAKTTMLPEPLNEDAGEDAEAAAALQRILDEAGEDAGGRPLDPPPACSDAHAQVATPASAPPQNSFASSEFPSVPDIALDSLAMPSTPTDDPTAREAKLRSKKPVGGAAGDEDRVDSWCIICYTDASVQCFGCDKDLYCWGCWREGHTGESAGFEEKKHVWGRWSRNKAKRGR
ncbi:MAG: hypothetical protein Q9163_003247 [Psora crenata]